MIPTITNTQREQMERDGFFVLPDVFTQAEMDELAVHIEAHQKRHEERIRQAGGTQGISRAEEITFTSHLAENDAFIRDFVTRPEFVALTTTFLGPDTDLYWNQSVFKQPEGEKEFPWHQDDGYTEMYLCFVLNNGILSAIGTNAFYTQMRLSNVPNDQKSKN